MYTDTLTTATRAPRKATTRASFLARARVYFASDSRRAIQTALGLLWLLDGALQLQPFMYSGGFIKTITRNAAGQPRWLADSITWAAHLLQQHLLIGNTLAALTQLTIGLGLLHRRTVKPALALSFAWSITVWWFGEAFGMLFTNAASPLTGAPGAVVLHAIIGLAVWPTERPGGLLGVRGARASWAVLWLLMAWLWLLTPNSSANAASTAIGNAASGVGWLTAVQHQAASAAAGNDLLIATLLAALSAAICVAGAVSWRPKLFMSLASILSLTYWVLGQGLGAIPTGSATDPNAGPALILLAVVLYALSRTSVGSASAMGARSARATSAVTSAAWSGATRGSSRAGV